MSFRPDPIVFSVVWAVLYILLGVDLVLQDRDGKSLYVSIALVCVLGAWSVFYSRECVGQPPLALGVLLASLGITWYLIMKENRLLLAPLGLWLVFAGFLSVSEMLK